MYQAIVYEKNNYLTLLLWVVLGIFTGPLVYAAVPIHMLLIKKKGEWLWLLLGLWLVLTLSDSRQQMFSFATNLKTIMMLVLGYLYTIMPKEGNAGQFIKPFIPFFIVAFISLVGGPVAFGGFQKTVSYVLLLLVVPGIVNLLLTYERERFLFHLIMIGVVVLLVGLGLRFVLPGFVIFHGERFSGLLGNPNGLGIYAFLFMTLFTIIIHFHKNLFTRNQTIFVFALIIASLVMGGSRGGIFSSGLFILAWFLLRRNVVFGFITMIGVFISYQLVMNNFVEIITSLGLEDYFRLETLKTGSGRIYVTQIAWENIQNNYWFSHGFTFNELILLKHEDFLSSLGHIGNFHNSWLTIWIDTGLIGLILFVFAWVLNFIRAAKFSPLIWALFFGILLSGTVESWLTASLNPYTIVVVIMLSMTSNEKFYINNTASGDLE